MLSLLMFIFGLMMFNRRRASIALLKLQAEGAVARTAGLVLMLPLLVSLSLGVLLGLFVGNDLDAFLTAVETVALLELAGIILAAAAAYYILRYQIAWSRLNDGAMHTGTTGRPPFTSGTVTIQPPVPPAPVQFPSVMTTKEAAGYLRVPEQRIVDGIYNGELAAVRSGNSYRIARIALDDFRERL